MLKKIALSCIQLLLAISIAYIIAPYTLTWFKKYNDQLTLFFVFQFIIFLVLILVLWVFAKVIDRLFRISFGYLSILIFPFLFRTTLLTLFTTSNYYFFSSWLSAIALTSTIVFIWDVQLIYKEKEEKKTYNTRRIR